MGFRALRVINEDWIQADNGFGTHPHANMEILSYVASGQLQHRDSMGNGSVLNAGEYQIITAGSGITHSEFNPSSTGDTHLFQIWILPDTKDLEPRYDQRSFPRGDTDIKIRLVASKGGKGDSLHINQDVNLYSIALKSGEEITLPLSQNRYGWMQVVKGDVAIDDLSLTTGDGLAIQEEVNPTAKAVGDAELLFFDLA